MDQSKLNEQVVIEEIPKVGDFLQQSKENEDFDFDVYEEFYLVVGKKVICESVMITVASSKNPLESEILIELNGYHIIESREFSSFLFMTELERANILNELTWGSKPSLGQVYNERLKLCAKNSDREVA